MLKTLSRDARVAVISSICAAVIAAPSGAMAVKVANADKVDGKHAVGAGASVTKRAGKLVATNSEGRLPDNIIAQAPDSALFDGQTPGEALTQWMSVGSDGTVLGASVGASDVTVTHPAAGTYCISPTNIVRQSVSGNIQSQVNAFQDLTLVITSLFNTSACPGELRIYTALNGALSDSPFTLTFARTG